MVTLICEKTGLTFQAKTKRSKNHPKVSEILSDANKSGVYSQVKEACEIIKSQEITETDAIDFLKKVSKEKSAEKLSEIFENKKMWKDFQKSQSKVFAESIDEEDADLKSRNYESRFKEYDAVEYL
jgi:hypothetical protein